MCKSWDCPRSVSSRRAIADEDRPPKSHAGGWQASGCSGRLENMLFGLSLGWDGPTLFLPRIPHGFSARSRILVYCGSIRARSGLLACLSPGNRQESPARNTRKRLTGVPTLSDQLSLPRKRPPGAKPGALKGILPILARCRDFSFPWQPVSCGMSIRRADEAMAPAAAMFFGAATWRGPHHRDRDRQANSSAS